ncbi:MAG TPA: TonB-dependent receptor [Verrucomicrobiae bacterium]|nr:TonB-dependent receptor [Verrucomicrobiae bacterium]
MKSFTSQDKSSRSLYWSVISFVALSCGGTALAQTNGPAASGVSTNVTDLGNITVVGQLDQARSQIVPNLGATAYTQTKEQIESSSQGGNAPFGQVILRAPGVAQDNAASNGLHVRGEHANLQYRINDVLLPEGISGFGLELDPRFVDSMQLITGSLPAQYGFRTAGVIDIQTKSGAFQNGGEVSMYGGSYDTVRPSFEYGGADGKFNYFVNGSFDHNALGIENPAASHSAIHDITDQEKLFTYMSYLIDDTSRVSFIGSASYSDFQIPNTPGLPVGTASDPAATPWNTAGSGLPGTFDSSALNENQNEQNYYGVISYQKTAGSLDYQLSVFARNSSVHFTPDPVGDLYFNGAASDVARKLYSAGAQLDGSFELNDKHTIRGGAMFLGEYVVEDSATTVFPVDGNGTPTGPAFPIVDDNNLHGLFTGMYLQDEWKVLDKVTINYGARLDIFNSSFDNEWQISPRVNLIWQPRESTTVHAGYSRYFTPPPVEGVSGGSVAKFDGTSNSTGNDQDDPVKAERADYYDIGISQKLAPGLTVGLDGYYKHAHNQLDDGLFGQTLILSAFNYAKGEIYGVEATGSFERGGFSTYANLALSVARGEDWNSSQFLFGADGAGSDLAYVRNHWIYLDHDQRVTGSFGAAYTWKEGAKNSTRVYVDALYGSGLRTDATDSSGENVPNGGSVPGYYSVNLGAEQSFKIGRTEILKARLDIVNVTDNSYELRDGGGVGVNAASFGERIGFFGSISLVF